MSGKWATLIEMIFVYGIVLGLAVWQLISVRRELRRDREAARDKPANDASKTPPD